MCHSARDRYRRSVGAAAVGGAGRRPASPAPGSRAPRKLELHLEPLLTAEQVSLSPRTRLLIEDQQAEWRELDRRIEAFDEEFAREARADEAARLLLTIPGIGPLNATALV